jgi:hypothetical protein
MLWAMIAVALIFIWWLGLLTGLTMGGVIHILLFAAFIMLVVRLIQEKKYYNSYLEACRRR